MNRHSVNDVSRLHLFMPGPNPAFALPQPREIAIGHCSPAAIAGIEQSRIFRRVTGALMLSALWCVMSQPCRAEVVEYRAQGTVSSVDSNNGLLPLPVSVGDALVFEFSFDTAAIDTITSVNYQGRYAVTSMTVTVGTNAPVAVTDPRIAIQSDPVTNLWGIAGCLPSCASATNDSVRLNFFPPSGSILTDALTLPPYPPPAGTFVQFGFFSSENPGGLQDSVSATLVSFGPANDPPTADAGPDLGAAVGERVQLSGILSSDPETPTLALQYEWSIASGPSGSTAALENSAVAVTGFTPDIPGDYILALVVRDAQGLASEAAYALVRAEISPAFVYERLAGGGWNGRYGVNRSEWSYDYFYPYGLVGGRPYGLGIRGDYAYDWSTGSYTSQWNHSISALGVAGEERLVERGDPMPGSNGATFDGFGLTGRSSTKIGVYGYGVNAAGQWTYGEFDVDSNGAVSTAPRPPFAVTGESETLAYAWRSWNSRDLSLIYGSNNTSRTRQRTVSYACGTDGVDTCTQTYTEHVWHYGLYVLDGSTATTVADTATRVPGEQAEFSGFGAAARDPASGTAAFVGYWIDGTGQWRQGLFRKSATGVIEKVLHDRDPQWTGGWFGRVAIDAEKVYFGGTSYGASGYQEAAGGLAWWSGYRTGIYSASTDGVKAEVEGGYSWFQRYNPELYQYSYAYSWPDYWNFAVGPGVLGFTAYTSFYSYDSQTQTWSYSNDYGTYWKEDGHVRKIARPGEPLDGTAYQYVAAACCYGDWLEKRTAVLSAQNWTWTYDDLLNESTSTGTIDTVLARFDSDRDGRGDDVDNCPVRPNPDQLDTNGNGVGDPCEDTDLDGWQDVVDNCPVRPNNQNDLDGDTRGDACDVCPAISDDQSDQDGDGIGDACDNDMDNDLVTDDVDICPSAPNADQANLDSDRFGDACDPDIDGDGIANAVDGEWDGQNYTDQSQVASNDFSDHALGGRSYGRIASRGQLILLVEDASGTDEGLLVSAVNGSGSGLIKQCDFKGKDAGVRVEQGSVVAVSCGSLRVRALARGAQIVLDDDVLIDVQQQSEARVIGLGDGEFRVENVSDTPLPMVVNLGDDVQVSLPTASIATISEPAPGSYEVENAPESVQAVAVTVDGRTTEVVPGETREVESLRDTTAPVITPIVTGTLGDNGWYTSDVQVSWTVTDPETAIVSSSGCGPTTVGADTAGTVITCSATSVGGAASQSVTIKRDATAPQVSVATPADAAIYTINQSVTASFSCSDAGSGVVSCVGDVPPGSRIDTASVGARTFTVSATDQAGNLATAVRSYSVRYGLLGFQSPIDNLPVFNSVNAGRTVPVKWQLQDAAGTFVTTLSSFRSLGSYAATCDAGAVLDEIEELAATGGTALRYDATSNQFIYNWATASSWKGKCRKLVLELADGQKKEALFRFR